MKTNNKKNNRRIAAVEATLNRLARAPALTPARRKAKSQPRRRGATSSMKRVVDDSVRYAQSIINDELTSHCLIPSQMPRAYAAQRYNFRTQLSSGATSRCASCIVNPYLLFTTNLLWNNTHNGAEYFQYCPTAMVNAINTPAYNWPSGTPVNIMNTPLFAAGQFPTAGADGYGGYVRVQGVRFRITYTGTELNKGGIIHVFHNPEHASALMPDSSIVASGENFISTTTTLASLEANASGVSSHYIGDSFEWVWRPSHTEFVDVTSVLDAPLASVAAGDFENSLIYSQGYFPDDKSSGNSCPLGWCAGFMLIPAAGTPATALDYYLEIEALLDVNLHQVDGSAGKPTATVVQPTRYSHSAPQKQALVHNVLGAVHLARSSHIIPPGAKKLAVKGLKSSALGMMEGLGERFMSSLPGDAAAAA